jgi:hypothetical protein
MEYSDNIRNIMQITQLMSKHLPPIILYVEIIWAMFPAGKVVISPMALSADPMRATLRYEYFRMRGPTKRPESTDM